MILMDESRNVVWGRFRQTAHCMSTLPGAEGTAELLAFAERIGLRPEWLQHGGTPREHFDLFDGAIERAFAAGAEVVTARTLVVRCVRAKR